MLNKFGLYIFCFSFIFIFAKCQSADEKELIFETAFTYYLEERDQLNFEFHSSLNGLDSAYTKVRTLKQDPTIDATLNPPLFLTQLLYDKIEAGKLQLLQDGKALEMTDENKFELLHSTDTSQIEDIASIGFMISSNERWKNWASWKIKQTWVYDSASNRFQIEVNSVIPIFSKKGKNGEQNLMEEFKIEFKKTTATTATTLSLQEILNNKQNIWVKQSSNFVSFENIKFLKGAYSELEKVFLGNVLSNKTKAYQRNYYQELVEIEPSYLSVERRDTIVTFDPETYEENMQVVHYPPVKFDDIKGFNIIQNWYFDLQDLTLKSSLEAIAPLMENKFDEGYEERYLIKLNE